MLTVLHRANREQQDGRPGLPRSVATGPVEASVLCVRVVGCDNASPCRSVVVALFNGVRDPLAAPETVTLIAGPSGRIAAAQEVVW